MYKTVMSPAQTELHLSDIKSKAYELWDIDSALGLNEACATFYLLLDLSLDGMDEGKFDSLCHYLLQQFASYTDMVVGGELRHANNKINDKAEIPAKLRIALKSVMRTDSRSEAWLAWYHLRRTYGTIALEWADHTFRLFKGGGYGGPKWGNIASHLLKLERKEFSGPVFIDFCWGLEHNGGNYFNKVWSPPATELLDAKRESDMETICRYAPKELSMYWEFQRAKYTAMEHTLSGEKEGQDDS